VKAGERLKQWLSSLLVVVNDIDILRRRLEANVLLIKAMGGGWDVSNLSQI